MTKRFSWVLAATCLAVLVTAGFAASPAQAFHRHHYGHFHHGQHFGHHYRHYDYYGYGPAYYPPPPIYAAPAYPAPAYPAPVVAGPVTPAPVAAAPVVAAPLPVASAYPAAPVPPGVEGTPNCLVVREYITEIEVAGKTAQGYGYACLQADGSWKRGAPAPVR